MKLNEATTWFLAGWAVTVAITSWWLVTVGITQDQFLFLALLGALAALVLELDQDMYETTRKDRVNG
jgi:hypothetical protein